MSGNYDSEELLDGSREASSAEGSAEGEDGSVLVNSVDSPNQVERIDQDDGVLVMGVDTLQDDQNEEKVIEDGGKDDMFVDCPDELVSFDGRIAVAENIEATVSSEPQQGFEGYSAGLYISDKGRGDDLTGELERLRTLLEKAVGEKESFALEYEAERRSLVQGLANLHHQLSALSTQGSLVDENDGGLVSHYDSENWTGEKSVVSDDTPLQDVIYDCSKLVKHALDDRSQTQGTISELHSTLHKSNQEIQELTARIAESSVQQDTEAIANRVLSCLASAFNQDEMFDISFTQKMCHIENATLFLIENYNSFLYETDLLRQCITNVRSDHNLQDGVGSIFLTAREELAEIRRKEVELTQKVVELEEKNSKQMEELVRGKEAIDVAHAEIQKAKMELEHEKTRFNNTKEKLSLAVTKGKALVQHRDSLKQSLADKTNELERCRIEIQQKASALEAAELCKEELTKSEVLAASLNEELSKRNSVITSCEKVLLESNLPEDLQSIDFLGKVQWLADEKNKLMGTLQDTTIITREAANKEIERLTALILVETQEKHYLEEELEDLRCKYAQIVEKEYQYSSEMDRMVSLLHEASGVSTYSAKGSPSDLGFMIDQCVEKIKDQASASISSHLEGEIFEKMQSLLYTRDQEAMLFEEILEEDILNTSEMNQLVDKVAVVSQELNDVRAENDSLHHNLSRAEEKATLLREKLSMAVKKGKGLVQERENLKQLLERTREMAQNDIDQLTASILTETQQNNYLLDELEDLRYKYKGIVESEQHISVEKNRLMRMLHEASGIKMNDSEELHSDMDSIVDRCFGKLREQSAQVEWKLFERIQTLLYTRVQEAMLFEVILEDDMMDRSRVNELTDKISVLSQELQDLKDEKDSLQNLLSHSEEKTIILGEDLSAAIKERMELAQEQVDIKQFLDKTREAAHIEIDRLTSAILAETQEKHYLEEVVEDLRYKYEGILEKEHQISLDRGRVVRMLQEASGMALNDPEEIQSDMDSIINQCFVKLKEQTEFSVESSQVRNNVLKRIQSLLYIRDFEAMLFKTLLEEEIPNESEVNHLTNKIAVISEELKDLKDEKDSLLNDLSRSEEKATLLREKLSMAVKKGKGLVQERENLKQLLDEKNAAIEKLKLELEQQELSLIDYRTEIHKLSSDADCVPKLEIDLKSVKEERDQLEQFLAESNRMLQRLIGSIENITFPDSPAVEEPAEKVQRLARYISECEAANAQAQHELELVRKDVATKSSELALANTKISVLVDEKEDAQSSKVATEVELQKVKEEASCLSSELDEAHKTIKALEDAMSQVQTNLSLLAEEYSTAQVGRTNLESEIEKLKEVAGMQARELANASSSMKSYEEAIWKAENTISELSGDKEDAAHEIQDLKSQLNSCMQELGDKQNAEEEIINLKSQLNACVQELAGTRGAKGIESTELYGHLSSLQLLLKDESALSLLRQSFQGIFDGLKKLDHILTDTRLHSNDMEMNIQPTLPIPEEDLIALNQFPDDIYSTENIKMVDGELTTADDDNFASRVEKTVDNLQLKHKILADVCVRSSSFMDNLIASLSKKLTATRAEFLFVLEQMKALKKHINDMEMDKQAQDQYMGTVVENLQNSLQESSTSFEKVVEERDIYQSRVCKLEADLEAFEILCSDMRHKLGDHQAKESKWQEREKELMSLYQKETEDPLLSAFQLKSLFKKIDGIDIPFPEFEVEELEPHDPDHVKKLFYIVDCVGGLQHEMDSMSRNNELQQSIIKDQAAEIEHLKEEASAFVIYKQDYDKLKHDLAKGLENIIKKLAGNEVVGTQKTSDVLDQLPLLEKLVTAIIFESENSKSKAQELDTKILKTQEVVDELSSKVKFFERKASSGSIQERGSFEAHSLPPRSEISEIDDAGPPVNMPIPPGPSNAQVRSLKKGSSDQLAINIDSESDRLISKKDTTEDKGHVFKSLNTSGLVPRQGRTIADKIDGFWVAGDRALMGRPRARIGVIAYWLFLNIWLLSYIL